MSNEKIINIKVLLLGDIGVGKTTLCQKLNTGDFIYEHRSTIGVDFLTYLHKCNTPLGNYNYKLQFWDTTGQDKFYSLISCYFRRSNIILIMFDLSNNDSYKNILKWYSCISNYMIDNMTIILIGNKNDLSINADLTKINEFCIEHHIKMINISIKKDRDFNKLMDMICSNYNELPNEQQMIITHTHKYACCNIS